MCLLYLCQWSGAARKSLPFKHIHNFHFKMMKLDFVFPSSPTPLSLSFSVTPPLYIMPGGLGVNLQWESDHLINLQRLLLLTNASASSLFFPSSRSFLAPPLVIKQGFHLQPKSHHSKCTERERGRIKVIVQCCLAACRARSTSLIFSLFYPGATFVSFSSPVRVCSLVGEQCWQCIITTGRDAEVNQKIICLNVRTTVPFALVLISHYGSATTLNIVD